MNVFHTKIFMKYNAPMSEIYNVKKKIRDKQVANFISTEIEWVPLNSVEVSKDKTEIATEFLDTLDEDDDVQNVYTNLKLENY